MLGGAFIEVLLDPFAKLMTRTRAAKATALLTVLEQNYGWKSAQPVVSRELHVRAVVHLDLGQRDDPRMLIHDSVQMRRELPAGCAPLGPKIDQDGALTRGLNDIGLESVIVNVKSMGARRLVGFEQHRGTACPDGQVDTREV